MNDSSLSAGGRTTNKTLPGQIVLVLQGGGALGSYQVGVYQALHEAGIEPDWIIGTSIGAINASLIAGNEPENRLPRLTRVLEAHGAKTYLEFSHRLPGLSQKLSYWSTITHGIAGFFTPNPLAHASDAFVLGPSARAITRPPPCRRRSKSWSISISSIAAAPD